jgi:hypothetical protein
MSISRNLSPQSRWNTFILSRSWELGGGKARYLPQSKKHKSRQQSCSDYLRDKEKTRVSPPMNNTGTTLSTCDRSTGASKMVLLSAY